MKISREDVLRVAQLAHLELAEDEVQLYQGQLDAILTYIDKLNELDTSSVEPLAQVLTPSTEANPSAREDETVSCGTAEEVLKIAPDPSRPYFRVPKVLEK